MKRIITLVIAGTLFLSPLTSAAATARPTITVTGPEKGASFERTEKMPITWTMKNVNRPMVAFVEYVFKKRDTSGPSVGSISGGAFEFPVSAGDTDGAVVQDWGLNDSIPGTYAIRAQLRECNKNGCHYAPAGKALSKWSKTTKVKITNEEGWTPSVETDTTLKILSPNGGEEYSTGYGRSLMVKWEADNVPKKSIICLSLESKSDGKLYGIMNGSCKNVKDGTRSLKGNIAHIPAGKYWVHATIGAKTSKDGKDGPAYAEDISDDYFYLVD
jgi:hypothetical protein